MRAKKLMNLVEARSALSRITKEVVMGAGPIAITQRSRLAVMIVSAAQYEQDMAELERYRRLGRKGGKRPLRRLMRIEGDIEAGSRRLRDEYDAALRRSGRELRRAVRD